MHLYFMFVVTITIHILSNDTHWNLDTDLQPPKLHGISITKGNY